MKVKRILIYWKNIFKWTNEYKKMNQNNYNNKINNINNNNYNIPNNKDINIIKITSTIIRCKTVIK